MLTPSVYTSSSKKLSSINSMHSGTNPASLYSVISAFTDSVICLLRIRRLVSFVTEASIFLISSSIFFLSAAFEIELEIFRSAFSTSTKRVLYVFNFASLSLQGKRRIHWIFTLSIARSIVNFLTFPGRWFVFTSFPCLADNSFANLSNAPSTIMSCFISGL